jgi:hypothetical protein
MSNVSRRPLLDPYAFVVRRMFLDFLPVAESGEAMWCEEGHEPGERESLAQLFSYEWLGDPGVRLTSQLSAMFAELGFCGFGATDEEQQAWVEANGAPDAAGSSAERAVRQLHWNMVVKGELEETTAVSLIGSQRFLPEVHQKLADWFASLGYSATLDITQDRPELRDLP